VNAAILCPEATELRELLDGTLAEPRKSEVTGHLEACPACQQRLEGLVAGQESWTGAASQLRQTASVPEPALQQVVAEMAKPATGTATTDTPPASDDSALDFLDPPREPGHLGRLGKYEILEVIGRGGMGIVLKAFDESLHRVVAVKVMAPQLATSATARQRFVREVQAAAAVRDEHVVGIYAVEEAKNLPFFVMEYIGGQSLQERLDRTGPLEVKEILRIGMQAARGLAAAHAQGLIHRDVKPANILLENGVQRVKITDFGLARAADDASLTQSGVVAGTPQYMAPEQAEGRTLDHRADLFSLGSVLYTMCTGRAPFRATTPMAVLKRVCDDTPRPVQEVNPDIPDWLAGIVVRLHAKDPARRYQTAAEVADVLGQHLARYQLPPGLTHPPLTQRQPWRLGRTVAIFGIVALLLAIVWFLPEIRQRYLARGGVSWADSSDLGLEDSQANDAGPNLGSLRLLQSIGPNDTPITGNGVQAEEGGWRIDVNAPGKGFIGGGTFLRLFEVRGPFPMEGELLFRAKMKSKNNPTTPARLDAALYMYYSSEACAAGDSEWADYEVRYPLHLLRQEVEPVAIPLSLLVYGSGRVWIKDIKLLHVPPHPKSPPELRPGEELVKAFGYTDAPITRALANTGEGPWLAYHRECEGWWYSGGAFVQPIRLYEIRTPQVDGRKVVLRAKIKTQGLQGGVYPSISCDLKNGGNLHSPKPDVVAALETNWTAYETSLDVPRNSKPDLLRINLEALPVNQRGLAECAGIKDIMLLMVALPSEGKESSKEPVKLKSFSPASDPPLDKPDKLEDNAWRFDHSTANANRKVRLFELRDALPEGGEIIYRAKLKTQTDQRDFSAWLLLGEEPFSPFEVPHGDGVVNDFLPQLNGQKQEWTECEVRYPVQGFFHTDPPVIPISLSIYGSGAVWIKDIEIWHVPPEAPVRRPGEKLIRRFGPKDKPIRSDYARSADGWQFEVGLKPEVLRLFTIRDPEVKDGKLLFRAKMRTKGTYPSVNLQLTQRFPDQTFKGDVQRSTKAEGTTRWTDYEVWITLPIGQSPSDLELAIEAKGTDIQGNTYTVAIKDVEFLKAAPDK
jgi:serine/threonine protein kinase